MKKFEALISLCVLFRLLAFSLAEEIDELKTLSREIVKFKTGVDSGKWENETLFIKTVEHCIKYLEQQ